MERSGVALVLAVLLVLAGCSGLDSGGPPDAETDTAGAGVITVRIVAADGEAVDAGNYSSSAVSDVRVVDGAVNDALATVSGDGSGAAGTVLASSSREVNETQLEAALAALNDTDGGVPDDPEYPTGIYLEYDDEYVVVQVAIYDQPSRVE